METHMEQELTLDPKALKNELGEDEPPPVFEDQTWEASYVIITG